MLLISVPQVIYFALNPYIPLCKAKMISFFFFLKWNSSLYLDLWISHTSQIEWNIFSLSADRCSEHESSPERGRMSLHPSAAKMTGWQQPSINLFHFGKYLFNLRSRGLNSIIVFNWNSFSSQIQCAASLGCKFTSLTLQGICDVKQPRCLWEEESLIFLI